LLTGPQLQRYQGSADRLVEPVGTRRRGAQSRARHAARGKFDRQTSATAKKFIKPLLLEELRQEIEIFCDLFTRPAVEAGLRKFVESNEACRICPDQE